ncbi:hypothetical protein TNCV_232331 [Trichonephila clavipes]|nr:hypothetical protein TNCV_232331 [Trichonephila clavipes]
MKSDQEGHQISATKCYASRCRNCGGGYRGRVAIYRPFGELRRAKIVLSPSPDRRCQIETSESSKGVVLRQSLAAALGTIQVTVRLGSVHRSFDGRGSRVV